MSIQIDLKTSEVTLMLHTWLATRLDDQAKQWLDQKLAQVAQIAQSKTLFTAFSAVPRYLGKADLNLATEELMAAADLIPGWKPDNWSVDQVGRTLLLLAFNSEDGDRYFNTINKILTAADVGETIAFYQSLPLLPHPEKFQLRAAEGVRTNMTSVFNAVALNNPYPAQYLDDLAWNQMVLKALFVGSSLAPIYGLESRNNPQLCQMLLDYADERLSAKRTVSPELWELVVLFHPEAITKIKSPQAVCS